MCCVVCIYIYIIYNQLGKRNTKPPPGDGFFHPFLFKKPWRVFFSGLLRQVNQLGRVGCNIQLRIRGDHQTWKVWGSILVFCYVDGIANMWISFENQAWQRV